jgi:hypothetical protein
MNGTTVAQVLTSLPTTFSASKDINPVSTLPPAPVHIPSQPICNPHRYFPDHVDGMIVSNSVGSRQTRRDISIVEVAVRMFSRWQQENFFRYMRHEFALDHCSSPRLKRISSRPA